MNAVFLDTLPATMETGGQRPEGFPYDRVMWMDREELTSLIAEGPVRITMNNGRTFDVPNREFALVSDIAAHVLYRAEDGKLKAAFLPLVTMSVVEPIARDN